MSSVKIDVAFKSTTAVSACVELWKIVFDQIDSDSAIDLAVWELNGSVKVSPMSSQHNEGANTYGFPVDDFRKAYQQLMRSGSELEANSLNLEFIRWMTPAILKSFKSPEIQKRYSLVSNKGQLPFSIVVTDTPEWSLEFGPFNLLWKNRNGLTVDGIFERQSELRKAVRANEAKSRRLANAKKSSIKQSRSGKKIERSTSAAIKSTKKVPSAKKP